MIVDRSALVASLLHLRAELIRLQIHKMRDHLQSLYQGG